MIVRRTKDIKNENTEVSLMVSYGTPDVKNFFDLFCKGDWQSLDVAANKKSYHEADVRDFFECHYGIFYNYEEKWRKQLSGWLFYQGIKLGYLVKSAADPDRYYFGAKGMAIMQPLIDEQIELEKEYRRLNGLD